MTTDTSKLLKAFEKIVDALIVKFPQYQSFLKAVHNNLLRETGVEVKRRPRTKVANKENKNGE